MNTANVPSPEPALRWWQLRMVWLVISGPAVVVVASFFTLALALKYPEVIVASPAATPKSQLPAVQGRNHAATPGR